METPIFLEDGVTSCALQEGCGVKENQRFSISDGTSPLYYGSTTTGIKHVFTPIRMIIELVYPVLSVLKVPGSMAKLEK